MFVIRSKRYENYMLNNVFAGLRICFIKEDLYAKVIFCVAIGDSDAV